MNRKMAFSANNQRLTVLCNHHDFPGLFALQIFELVYMVDFITIAFGRTA